MTQTRRERQREETINEIKQTARDLMREHGTAGLSVRGIGRAMQMSATAIYRYFSSLDDLITALIIDDYNALADALEVACHRQEADGGSHTDQLYALVMAYRDWALAHPVDFQLIYGNPIPGYEAPSEQTIPPAQRSFDLFCELILAALTSPDMPSQSRRLEIPPEVLPAVMQVAQGNEDTDLLHAIYLTTVGWARIHGLIMLELFDHIQPIIGDTDAFYKAQVEALLRSMGIAFNEGD